MKILIITNPSISEVAEDKCIAEGFEKDGHIVKLVDKDYPEEYEEQFDIFIKRNCWSTDIADYSVDAEFDLFNKRIVNKNLPRINMDGKFDGSGKSYIAKLYKQGYSVIPTVATPQEIDALPPAEEYLLKPLNGYDAFGIERGDAEYVKQNWNRNYCIQTKIDFISEVQFYFVGNKFEYAFEFTPAKVPFTLTPTPFVYTDAELKLAQSFADLSPDYNGVQRVDFLRLADDTLLMLELEDNSPYLNFIDLTDEQRNAFVQDYKQMVYDYFEAFNK